MKLLVAVGLLLVALQVFAEETNSEDASMVAKRRFPAYRHVGCFRDRPRRAIPFLGGVPARGAVRACANLARKRGFTWFAVQYRTHCFAGRRAHITYRKYGGARNCRGGVGGAWANDVYRFNKLPYVSVGCFRDKHSRALSVYFGFFRGDIQRCARIAKSRGYKVFSVQYGGHCFSGPTAQKTYAKYGRARNCRHGLGGAWANNVYRFTPKKAHGRKFKKLNRGEVCFGARGNKPGIIRYNGPNRIVNGLFLVYKRGRVTCNKHSYSRWGCGDANLDVVVTDQYNYMIYPRREYIHHWKGLWYRLPGKHSKISKSLFFSNVAAPFHLSRSIQLKVWYGEDLKNWTEGDNLGRVCVDVYAWFA